MELWREGRVKSCVIVTAEMPRKFPEFVDLLTIIEIPKNLKFLIVDLEVF